MRRTQVVSLLLAATLLPVPALSAQDKTPPPAPMTTADAWAQLKTFASSKNPDERATVMTALNVVHNSAPATEILRSGLFDESQDVRIAALASASEMKNRTLQQDMRNLLADKEPEVSFAAATMLWKMGDHSGQDILVAIVRGDRKPSSGMLASGMHQAKKEVRNPMQLTKDAALQVGAIFVPPVGWGLGAYRFMHNSGGQNPRVLAVEQLSQIHSEDVKKELIGALDDKDIAVRVAAAEQLAQYRGHDVTNALATMIGDSKTEAQMMACASFIAASGSAPAAHTSNKK